MHNPFFFINRRLW